MNQGKFQKHVDATIELKDGEVVVRPDRVYVTREGTITWSCADGDWEVVMEGTSPLQQGKTVAGGKGQSKEARTTSDADKTGGGGDPDSPKGTHKYTARINDGGDWKEKDPEIIVGPEI